MSIVAPRPPKWFIPLKVRLRLNREKRTVQPMAEISALIFLTRVGDTSRFRFLRGIGQHERKSDHLRWMGRRRFIQP